ncbi:MAG TPA: hypothetical protein VGQ09_07425 [Chitinophagaceae bacterium]|jgi:hypothetical protein|nr:hypothetical protein [Chitinophagaceae bacterium]
MKTTTMLLPAIGLLLTIGFISCKKDSVHKSNTELLTQKTWKTDIHGLDENNNGVIEETESDMVSCEADDTFTFNTGGMGVYSSGTIQCGNEPSTLPFDWAFVNNETELAIFGTPEKINKLDENYLETYYEDQNSMGQTVKYIKRFRH